MALPPSLRPLLLLLAAALAGCGAPAATAALRAGPMLGHIGPEEALVWWQTAAPGSVELVLSSGPGAAERRLRVTSTAADDGCATARLDGLMPAHDYLLQLHDAHGARELAFRTPPPAGTAEDLTVGFGSCAAHFGPEPAQPVWSAVVDAAPDLFLWLGDNVYFDRDFDEWEDPAAMSARWRQQRALPALQPALACCAHAAIWDDHDFGPNDADGTYAHKDVALLLFDRYWANRPLHPDCGVYQSFQRGRVAFFLLDGRTFRAPVDTPAGEPKPLLGEAQWRRLEQDLRRAEQDGADWLVVVSGNQVLADYHRFETWARYPAERARLLALLADSPARVLLLSGDRHLGEVLVEDDPASGRRFVELTSSPLAAGIGGDIGDAAAPERLPGSQVRTPHFALLRFWWQEGRPAASYQPVGSDGRRLREPLRLDALLAGAGR